MYCRVHQFLKSEPGSPFLQAGPRSLFSLLLYYSRALGIICVECVRAVCARLGGERRVVCVRAVCARLGGKVVVVVVEAPTY